MNNTVIPPRMSPRNFTDGIISVIFGVIGMATLLAIAYAMVSFLIFIQTFVYNCEIPVEREKILFGTLWGFIILALIVPYFTVSSITITVEGIHFHRILGFPKFMPWSRIKFVSLAPRWELLVHGWLCPPFPPRAMTMSSSSLKHYRIQWNTGFCYYPPLDPKVFEQCVKEHLQTKAD